jgi:hypothetical protein
MSDQEIKSVVILIVGAGYLLIAFVLLAWILS